MTARSYSAASRHRGQAAVVVLTGLLVWALVGCAQAETLPPPPSVAPLTSDQAEQIASQELEQFAERSRQTFPGISLPDVDRVRFVSSEEYAAVVSQCLIDQGYGAHPNDTGGIKFDLVPEEQVEAQEVAFYVCQAKYPLDPKYVQPINDERLTWLRDYFEQVLVPCYAEHDVTTSPVPSAQTFIESWGTQNQWVPLRGVSIEPAQQEALEEDCPTVPDEFWGY